MRAPPGLTDDGFGLSVTTPAHVTPIVLRLTSEEAERSLDSVATDEALLEAAFVANYHRDDMTDLEEAHALKTLVDYYNSQTKAAKRLGIPQNTISSKLSLLKLAPELQKGLVTGVRKVEHVRNLGKLSVEEQKAKADERAEAARIKAEAQARDVVERSAGPADCHGVTIPETPAAVTTSPAPAMRPGARRA